MKKQDFFLTEHFKLSEFTRSATAERRGINNEPGLDDIANMEHLCRAVLEPLRQFVGHPILITSGFRCPELNYLVGGVGNSAHQWGCAADLHLRNREEGRTYFAFINTHCDFDQLLWEYSRYGRYWIHVSAFPDPRRNRHQSFSNYRATNV